MQLFVYSSLFRFYSTIGIEKNISLCLAIYILNNGIFRYLATLSRKTFICFISWCNYLKIYRILAWLEQTSFNYKQLHSTLTLNFYRTNVPEEFDLREYELIMFRNSPSQVYLFLLHWQHHDFLLVNGWRRACLLLTHLLSSNAVEVLKFKTDSSRECRDFVGIFTIHCIQHH